MSAVNNKLNIFLCTGNSCRSRMEEGWAHTLKSDVIEAWSAGIEKHGWFVMSALLGYLFHP